jgi:hypothetical protein
MIESSILYPVMMSKTVQIMYMDQLRKVVEKERLLIEIRAITNVSQEDIIKIFKYSSLESIRKIKQDLIRQGSCSCNL